MSTSGLFGNVADLSFTHEFASDLSEEQIAANVDILANEASQVGIDARIHRVGRAVHFAFDNPSDAHILRELIAQKDGTDVYLYRHDHTSSTEAYARAWSMQAEKTLNDAGLDHDIEQQGGYTVIRFQSYVARLMFLHLADAGYIDRRAELTLRSNGLPGTSPP